MTKWRGSKVVQELQVCLELFVPGSPKGCVPLGIYRVEETKGFIDGIGTIGLQGADGHNGSIEGHYIDTLIGSANPQVRSLRRLARTEYMEEKKRFESIPITALSVLALKSREVTAKLREVLTSYFNIDSVVYIYGRTTKFPAFFVFGKAPVSVSDCVKNLRDHAVSISMPVLVVFGLEYAHAIQSIKDKVVEVFESSKLDIQFAELFCSTLNPLEDQNNFNPGMVPPGVLSDDKSLVASNRYSIGGSVWKLHERHKVEDYLLFWIGSDNSVANVVLTFNGCEIVSYDATANCKVTDLSQQKRILKRGYYLVEKAKDANIVGILVGTLGVAGYLHMINQMKELISTAGKKNFICDSDVFIYVSCAQTALLDGKEYLAPVITPFEAMLAFNRGSQWTGAYIMEFRDLINSSHMDSRSQTKEARLSFLQGGYVEDFDAQENSEEVMEGALASANATEKALQSCDNVNSLAKETPKSGAEFLAARSYQGLDIHNENTLPDTKMKTANRRNCD
ncbi:hypothetical protein UlMin_016415 [Ulmus minor]